MLKFSQNRKVREDNMREKILFDDGWLFHRGELGPHTWRSKGPTYMQSKTERRRVGPASRYYNDAPDDYGWDHELSVDGWEKVSLPHDYIISGEVSKENNCSNGFFEYTNGWYRKHFTLGDGDRDRQLVLYFEGVATGATVYLNGCLLRHNFCAYTPFTVDITDFVIFGKDNVLAVYVTTDEHEGWWYEGGGINRHVYLIKTNTLHADTYGLYVAPSKREDGSWELPTELEIKNDRVSAAEVSAVVEFADRSGAVTKIDGQITAGPKSSVKLKLCADIKAPHLWDIDDPYLYTATATIYENGAAIDSCKTNFGFRTFTGDGNGFYLNGRKIFINGVCAHQDFGLTGRAVADSICRYKVKLIKEMGANGYRCSHYPHNEATMDALDEAGILVMDETRHFESSVEGLEQLETLIKRDRNHPSVVLWSIGNEEMKFLSDDGRRIAQTMIAKVMALDNTRMIMAAVSNEPPKSTVNGLLDAIGMNYNHQSYEETHALFPDKPIFSSECCATGTTRGWYYPDDSSKGYINALDHNTDSWFRSRTETWKFLHSLPYVAGGFQWIAFEHRGEAVWPRLCSQSGAIDLFLQKKDAFYQNQSLFITDRPILHIATHWNFAGEEGETKKVRVYTNLPEVSLELNGKAVGRVAVEPYGYAEFDLPYTPGVLCAAGYKDGKAVACDRRETTGRGVALKLIKESDGESANGRDVIMFSCIVVDEKGREVPTAAPFVSFNTNGLCRVIGTGSDISDHIPVTETSRRMRAGRISVAVAVGKSAGKAKLYAHADGLDSAVITFELN